MDANIFNEKVESGDQDIIDHCAQLYENFVQMKMDKANMPGFQYTSTYYLDVQPRTLYYNYDDYVMGPSEMSKGQEMFNCHDISGAGGWFMNPVQYAAFIDGLFNEHLVSADNLQKMKDEQLGMYGFTGEYGTYYTHNGGGGWTSEGIEGRGGQCVWMYFPVANVSLFITWNSLSTALESGSVRRELVKMIFENAYTD